LTPQAPPNVTEGSSRKDRNPDASKFATIRRASRELQESPPVERLAEPDGVKDALVEFIDAAFEFLWYRSSVGSAVFGAPARARSSASKVMTERKDYRTGH